MALSDLLFFPLATLPGALETFLFLLESGMEGARDWRIGGHEWYGRSYATGQDLKHDDLNLAHIRFYRFRK